eukprot:5669503-Alexandrium_andersonii.AAC.1
MPRNTAEQRMPQLSYAAILYVLIRRTPRAQDNKTSTIQCKLQQVGRAGARLPSCPAARAPARLHWCRHGRT